LSVILPFSSLSQGPDEVGQKGLKLLHLWHHPQNIPNPKPKIFLFHCRLKDLPSFLRV